MLVLLAMKLSWSDGMPPGVEVSQLRTLPLDLDAWQRRVIGACLVREMDQTQTTSGWPVTLIRSDEVRSEGVVTARLHAFYTLIDHGCVAWVAGVDVAAVEAQRAMLLAADVDWGTDQLVALVELWS